VGGAAVGYVAITFVYYWWHRWRHKSSFLWRVFHQVHHSPQRIEIITSFYKHPVEVLANGILSSAIVYLGVGLRPGAAAGAVALSGLAELVYHWNVRTPHWLGYFIQRPESHCVHH
jgi:sterol desaturase/sphingolipid hydroxylase (fatty acid hydroxylase superfamily)